MEHPDSPRGWFPQSLALTGSSPDEHGIWSDAAGGFVERDLYTRERAQGALTDLIARGEDPEDLRVLQLCHDHADDEQPADGCELCDRDEDEDEE